MKNEGSLVTRLSAAGLDWIVPDWPVPPHIHALSTTRHGARGSVLDFGHRRGDAASSRRQLSQWLPNEPVWVAQAHGNIIIDADREEARATRCKGDGIVSRVIDRPCVVLTADCLPVLLTDRQATVVAAVHAGWRGIAAGVLEAAITALKASPARVLAWLGPAIGPEAFEVGRDVLEALCEGDSGATACFKPRGSSKWLADLYALARRRLSRAGVDAVYGGGRCTFNEREAFHSYRRDGPEASGRMATVIWRTGA